MYLVSCTKYKEFVNGYLLQFEKPFKDYKTEGIEIMPFEYMVAQNIELSFEPMIFLN